MENLGRSFKKIGSRVGSYCCRVGSYCSSFPKLATNLIITIRKRPSLILVLLAVAFFLLSIYYIIALIAIYTHASALTFGWKENKNLGGLALSNISFPRSASASSESSLIQLDVNIRNSALSQLVISGLTLRVDAAGISKSKLFPRVSTTKGDDSPSTIFNIYTNGALVLPGRKSSLSAPRSEFPMSSSSSPPLIQMNLNIPTTQQWLQSVIGLIARMPISEGYASSSSSSTSFREEIADLRVSGGANVVLSWLWPFTVTVSASSRVSLSKVFESLGNAAIAGTPGGQFSFSSLFSTLGGSVSSSSLYGVYQDIAKILGTQTLAVRIPFDVTGDVIAWYGFQRAEATTSAATASAATATTSTSSTSTSTSCCCSSISKATPSSSPLPEFKTLSSNLVFPAARPYGMTFGLSKVNSSGLLQPTHSSVSVLFCRMSNDLISASDVLLMRDIAMEIDALTSADKRLVRPGKTVIGTAGIQTNGKEGPLSQADQLAALKSATAGKVLRVKELVSYRRSDLCSQLASNASDSLFGLSTYIPPMTLQAVSGRPGFINIDGEIDKSSSSSSLPGRLPTIASLRLSSLSSAEAIAIELSLNSSQLAHARRTIREFVLGIDDGEPTSPVILRGSPRVSNPVSPKGVARLWSCSPQQTPIGLYAAPLITGSIETHPLAGIFDGLFTCVTSPYIDAVAGIQGGVRVATSKPDIESLFLYKNKDSSTLFAGGNNRSLETASVHARGGATLVNEDISTSYLSPSAALFARNGTFASSLNSFCLGDSLVTTSSDGKHLIGWAVGKGINYTYAAQSLADGNGQRDRGSIPLAAGLLERALPPFDQDPRETLSSAADPPWVYVRSSLLSSDLQNPNNNIDDGSGSLQNTEETSVKVKIEKNSPLCLPQTTQSQSGGKSKVSLPEIKNFRRRLTLNQDVPIDVNEEEKDKSQKMIKKTKTKTKNTNKKRNLSPSAIPGVEAFDDPLGGLLATFGSWYASELKVEYERLDWDPLTVWSGNFDELGWGGRSSESYATASGMSGKQLFTRAQDPCGLLLSHDMAVLSSCCSNTSHETAGDGFGYEGYRTASASGVAKFKGATLRTLLFNTIGDVQPIVLPTLLLRHVSSTNSSYSRFDSSTKNIESQIKTEVAAVIRGCAVAIPDTTTSTPNPGGNRVSDTRKYGQIQGAYYADGDLYRVRLRATVTIVDPVLIWGGAKRYGSLDSAVLNDTKFSARSVFDVLINGATQTVGEFSGEASSAAASLLLSAIQAQRGINLTSQGTENDISDDEILPSPPSQWNLLDGDDSSDGNATNSFLAGTEWRISVASLSSTVNTLQDRCIERKQDIKCFLKPKNLLNQQRSGKAPLLEKNSVSFGGVKTIAYPPVQDPFLWNLLSGLTFNLHLPTRRDTAEFRESRDRAWPQHMSSLASAIYSSLDESSFGLFALLGQSGFAPLSFAYSREAGTRLNPAPRVGVARNLIDVMTGHPKTEGGVWSVNKMTYNGPSWELKDKDAIMPRQFPTFILNDNKNYTSSFVCPINALCLGSQNRTDGSGFIRGPNVTCAYQIIREACIARWNTTNPFYSILQVPNVINGSVILARACSALIDTACSEWIYEHTDFYLSRDQDVPNFIMRLPDIDLGNGIASIQVVPICYQEDGEPSAECDPQSAYTFGADAPPLFDAFANHAATITFSGVRNDAAMLQKISMKLWLSFNPMSDEVGSKVSIQPLSHTKFWIRTLPASRSVLLVSLVTRTRLLTRLLSRHRQLDYSLPLRLFPLAAASAHFATAGLTLSSYSSFLNESTPTLVTAIEPAEFPLKIGSTPLAQVYESLIRPHIWVDTTGDNIFLGLVLINTMVSELAIHSLQGVALSGILQDISNSNLVSKSFTVLAGNTSAINNVNNCSLGIRLNEAPLDIARYGLESFTIRGIYSDSPSTTRIDTQITNDGCSIILGSKQSLLISTIANATGISPLVLRQGVSEGWIKHILLPLYLSTPLSVGSFASLSKTDFQKLVSLASIWNPGSQTTSTDAAITFSSVSLSLNSGKIALVPSFLRKVGQGKRSTIIPGTAIGSVAHILHLTSGSIIVQLLSLPSFAVKLVPFPTLKDETGILDLDLVLIPASLTLSSSSSQSTPTSTPKPYAKPCPYLSEKGVCTCPSSSTLPTTPIKTDPTSALKFKIEYIRIDFTPASRLWLSVLIITNVISFILCCIGCCSVYCFGKGRRGGSGGNRAQSYFMPCCCASFALQCERNFSSKKQDMETSESESDKVLGIDSMNIVTDEQAETNEAEEEEEEDHSTQHTEKLK